MTYEQFVKDYPGFTQYPKEEVEKVIAFIKQQLDFHSSNIIDQTQRILDLRDKLDTCIFNEAP